MIMRAISLLQCVLQQSVSCFSHSLQCCLNKVLEEDTLSEILKTGSAIVGHFKHSNIASAALKAAQRRLKISEHRLINRCNTRWNSTFAMAERLLEQREAIHSVLDDRERTSDRIATKLLMTSAHWKILEDVVVILKPFEVATTIMSTESRSTLAMVRPLIHSFQNKFLRRKEQDSRVVEQIKSKIRHQLDARFLSNDSINVCSLACILDPRLVY